MSKKLIPIALGILLLLITVACGGGCGGGKTLEPGKAALQAGTTFCVPAGEVVTVKLHLPRYQYITAWRWHTADSASEVESQIEDELGKVAAQSGRTSNFEEEFKVKLGEGDYLISFSNQFDSTNSKQVWLQIDWYGESLAR
jgi:hypothetical protein